MPIRTILLLGNPKLYEKSELVQENEFSNIKELITDLHDTLMDSRKRFGWGRAIAAPQIGVMKRVFYMYVDKPIVFINPSLHEKSIAQHDVWDDCFCFPDLFVKVLRHQNCRINYTDLDGHKQDLFVEGDLSELLEHEYDHLDGVLSVLKAIDKKSFALKSEISNLKNLASGHNMGWLV